ncbi:flagellar brake protein [Saccharospirillum salsuginis]|uniref:PilZ domain-containing protein n=1 Tax=Saccharospirillum salsuginis TaxID=418750 RepID=A0A918N952_9GAMM|nr:flagellar brake protein [Saccharospirillum salsuginis]GGX49984.1 hypothetical protein GCM10007392_16760 [Saccharospirillum salsuginis]
MNQSTEGEAVTNPADIVRLLRTAQEDVIPVSLVFTQSQRSLSTYVIDVDPQTGLTLDEPMPRALAGELASGTAFTLETHIDGVQIRAPDLSARAAPKAGDEPRFQCPLPAVLYTNQRRRSYRAQVRRSLLIGARVRDEGDVDCTGRLRDMSVDGCGIEFEQDVRARFPELGMTLTIELDFPNHTRLECPAVLQRMSFNGDAGITTLGCRLATMPAQRQTAIAALVTDLQRDQINFRKKGGLREEIPERFLSPEGEPVPVQSPVSKPSSSTAGRRPAKAARSKSASEPRESVEAVWRNTLAAVRRQQQHNRAEPTPDLAEAVQRLSRSWHHQRQPLFVHSRIRSADNTDIEQRTAIALILADHCANKAEDCVTVFAKRLMQGLLRRLPDDQRTLAQLIAAQDALAYRLNNGRVYYQPTQALGQLHRKGQFDAQLIRWLIETQGLYSLGSAVRLSDDSIALVLRHDSQGQPLWVRQVYRISEQSPLPPKDVRLEADGPTVEGPADPVKADLAVDLLRPALRQ